MYGRDVLYLCILFVIFITIFQSDFIQAFYRCILYSRFCPYKPRFKHFCNFHHICCTFMIVYNNRTLVDMNYSINSVVCCVGLFVCGATTHVTSSAENRFGHNIIVVVLKWNESIQPDTHISLMVNVDQSATLYIHLV